MAAGELGKWKNAGSSSTKKGLKFGWRRPAKNPRVAYHIGQPKEASAFWSFGFAPKNGSRKKTSTRIWRKTQLSLDPPNHSPWCPTSKRVPCPTGDGNQDHPTLALKVWCFAMAKVGCNIWGQIVTNVHRSCESYSHHQTKLPNQTINFVPPKNNIVYYKMSKLKRDHVFFKEMNHLPTIKFDRGCIFLFQGEYACTLIPILIFLQNTN